MAEQIFSNGNDIIMYDKDGSKGGWWKLFNAQGQRIATLDISLAPIGQ